MKKYKVIVTTTFHYEDEVEASSAEEARQIMIAALEEGEVDAVSDTDDFDTEVSVEGEE